MFGPMYIQTFFTLEEALKKFEEYSGSYEMAKLVYSDGKEEYKMMEYRGKPIETKPAPEPACAKEF